MNMKLIIGLVVAGVLLVLFMMIDTPDNLRDIPMAAAATNPMKDVNNLTVLVQHIQEEEINPETNGTQPFSGEPDLFDESNTVQEIIYTMMKREGMNDIAAAAVLGNIWQESRYLPYAVQPNGRGFGLCQWTWESRKIGFFNYLKSKGGTTITDEWIATTIDPYWSVRTHEEFHAVLGDLTDQQITVYSMEWLLEEIHSAEYQQSWEDKADGYEAFKNSTDVMTATLYFHNVMEGSADSLSAIEENRGKQAQEEYENMQNGLLKEIQGAPSSSPVVPSNSQGVDAYLRVAEEVCADDRNAGYGDQGCYGGWARMDCSGFVSYCISKAIDPDFPCTDTTGLPAALLATGKFEEVTDSIDKHNNMPSQLKRGDVLVRPHKHTEFYYGKSNNNTIGSHEDHDGSTGDGDGKEICPTNGWSTDWEDDVEFPCRIFRYKGD